MCNPEIITILKDIVPNPGIFQTIRDIIVAIAAGVTAFVAYSGLEKWKAELRGKADYEVARSLIKSIYKLRDEIGYCRSPFIPAQEFPDGYQGFAGGGTFDDEGRAYAHVYSNRWTPVGEAAQQFDANLLEAEALWGFEIKEKSADLRQHIQKLSSSINTLIRD